MAINAEVIVFFFLVFISTRRYKGNIYFRFLPYAVILIFMAIRYDYGDGKVYRIVFNNIHSVGTMKNVEPLYVWINKLLPNYGMVMVITSLFYVLAIYYVISRSLTLRQRGLALLVMVLHPYILMVDISAIRQSIAIALIFVGVYIANEHKNLFFIPFSFIAALFHKSAIVLLPIVFLFGKRHFTAKAKWAILGGTAFFLIIPDRLLRLLETALAVTRLNTANYLAYLYNGNENSSLAVVLSFIIMIFLMLCGNAVEERNSVYVKLSILAMVFEALQGRMQQFGRINMYFLPFLMLSLPMILKKEPQTLEVLVPNNVVVFNKYACWLVEGCFIIVFIWKLIGFMTPQFAYQSIFTMQ